MKRQLSRRKFLRLAGLGVAGSVVAACQPQPVEKVVKETVEVEKEVEKEVTRVVEVEKVVPVTEISFATVFTYEPPLTTMNSLLDDFNASYPQIHAEHELMSGSYVEYLMTAFAGGVQPDLFWAPTDEISALIERGKVREVTSFSEIDGEFPTDWWPGTWEQMRYKGKSYGIPFEGSVTFYLMNLDLFDQAGVTPPTEDWTMDDILHLGMELTADGKGRHPSDPGFDRNDIAVWAIAVYPSWYRFMPLWREAGAQLISEDHTKVTLDTQEMLAVLAWYSKLFRDPPDGPINPGPGAEVGFATNNLAVKNCGSWEFPGVEQLAEERGLNWAWLPYPKWEERGKSMSTWCEKQVFISVGDRETEQAAYELGKWLLLPRQAATWCVATGYLPLTQGAFDHPLYQAAIRGKPWVRKTVEQFPDAICTFIWPGTTEVCLLMSELLNAIAIGQLKADDLPGALADYQEEMQEAFDAALAE